jgi:hypothetical protein
MNLIQQRIMFKSKMNTFFKTTLLLFFFSVANAQTIPLLEETNRWILVNNKIEKNEIFLTAYKKSSLRANTLVMSFAKNGKINYDYETNSKYESNTNIHYLDMDTNECSWAYDSLTNLLTLNIKGGYLSFDDFKFKRTYKIEDIHEGFILMKTQDIFYENLQEQKKALPIVKNVVKKVIVPTPKVKMPPLPKKNENFVVNDTTKLVASIEKVATELPASVILPKTEIPINPPVVVAEPVVKIDYFARNKNLLDKSKRWILVRNKIERGDIYLTPYDESKLSINNLVLTLMDEGKINYDYESDPKIKFCAGVDFLDIDTDETSWTYDGENNILTLTLKGGYASLDDFKFKRDYTVEVFDDGFALRKTKEYYFEDLRKAKTPMIAPIESKKRRK